MSDICGDAAVSRLCSLLRRSLRPFTELKEISLTPENEKQLLISLSQIFRQIRRWIDYEDVEQDEESISCPIFDSHSVEHECLPIVVSILISLLNVDNKYIQHLVGNVLLIIMEFLLACGGNPDKFVRLLCISFEIGLCNVFSHHTQHSFSGIEKSKAIPSNLSLISNHLTWKSVVGIIRVLRGMLKLSKGEENVELVLTFVVSLSTSLSEVPWDSLHGVQNNSSRDVNVSSVQDKLVLMNEGDAEVKILLVGNLVQLLCSLVGLIAYAEAESGSLETYPILHKICDLVPKMARWCLAEEQSFVDRCILAYFQHKFLMLMIRLSFHMQLDCSVLLIWLRLLHEYFEDLLSRPLSIVQCGQDESLEGSPLLLSFYDQDVCRLSLRHLQRRAVLLFVKCCLGLINPRKSSELTIDVKRTSSLFHRDSVTIDVDIARKKGLLEFRGWVQGKASLDIFSENQLYLEKCIKFASSFITLYMHEDDMLFEVLLEMLSIPSDLERMFFKDERSSRDTEEDVLYQISKLFNPSLVFLVFLAELQYDHQLLLDYLISKDTGSKCAEYLLRCLRAICDSWNLFLQLFGGETLFCQSNCQPSCKRKRTSLEDICAEKVATPLQRYAVSSEQNEEENEHGSNFFDSSIRFQDAKACLLSLKCALKKLHEKNLFPYNPEVLIHRYVDVKRQF